MKKTEYKKMTVDFPANEYMYLKMACIRQGVTLKDFVTRAIIQSVEDYEDLMDDESITEARKDIKAK